MQSVFQNAFDDAALLLEEFNSEANRATLSLFTASLLDTFRRRGKVLVCGNGGSMADSMHFAEEFSGRFRMDRAPLPVLALSDPTHITCVGNDYGFDHIFSRQVEALGHSGDILVLLSTSGNSPNLLLAATSAKSRSMTTVGLLGRDGGQLMSLCDLALVAPGATSDRIQELHMMALHAVIEAVEAEL